MELHNPRLRYIWLLCTQEVETDYRLIERWIRFLTDGRAHVELVRLGNRNDVAEIRIRVRAIYENQVRSAGLEEHQVIADMTSGTAAMTAGLILATLDEPRNVEYLSQGPKSLIENGEPRRDLTQVFQLVETSPRDVAQAFVSFLVKKTKVPDDDSRGSGSRAV